jgi:hypothetical protein
VHQQQQQPHLLQGCLQEDMDDDEDALQQPGVAGMDYFPPPYLQWHFPVTVSYNSPNKYAHNGNSQHMFARLYQGLAATSSSDPPLCDQ